MGKGSKGGTQVGFGVSSSPQDVKGPKAIKLTTHTNAIKIVLKVIFKCPSNLVGKLLFAPKTWKEKALTAFPVVGTSP